MAADSLISACAQLFHLQRAAGATNELGERERMILLLTGGETVEIRQRLKSQALAVSMFDLYLDVCLFVC